MTGFEVRKLRMSLELSVAEYAKLLGVTPDTIYRWERNLTALRMDPLQANLLDVLDSADQPKILGVTIRKLLVTRGPLYALHFVLKWHFDQQERDMLGRSPH